MIATNLFNHISGMYNALTGQGTSSDHGQTGAVTLRQNISSYEIAELLSHSSIMRAVCEAYAQDITRAWRTHTASANKMLLLEEHFELRDVVEKAVFFAEGFGGAFVVPRYSESVVDAKKMGKPMPALSRGLLGFAVYAQHELKCAPNCEKLVQPNGLPMYYAHTQLPNLKIHFSWMYPLRGQTKVPTQFGSIMSHTGGNILGQSRLDIIYDDFARMFAAYGALSHILVKGNIDVLKLKGLAEALSNCSDEQATQTILQKLVLQASATVSGANSFRPIVVDSDEELERKGGNHTGAADIVRELRAMFIAATRMPETKLFGTQAKGLNNGGEADTVTYYDGCASYRERRCTGLINWLDARMAPGTRTKWEYKPLWEMTAKEKIDAQKEVAAADKIYIDAKVPGIVEAIQKRFIETGQYEFTKIKPPVEESNA